MKKILVIDDDCMYISSISKEFEKNSLEIDWTNDAGHALKKFNEEEYHAIILDIMMTVPDDWSEDDKRKCEKGINTGLVLLEKIRTIDSQIPIIIYTCTSNVKLFDERSYYIQRPEFAANIANKIVELLGLGSVPECPK